MLPKVGASTLSSLPHLAPPNHAPPHHRRFVPFRGRQGYELSGQAFTQHLPARLVSKSGIGNEGTGVEQSGRNAFPSLLDRISTTEDGNLSRPTLPALVDTPGLFRLASSLAPQGPSLLPLSVAANADVSKQHNLAAGPPCLPVSQSRGTRRERYFYPIPTIWS